MTEKDLRKLNRYQLLELLIAQTKRADELQEQLERTRQELSEQNVKLSSLGSIAEASLYMTGVFEAAQKSADRYVNAAKKYAEDIERTAYEEAASILAQAQERARSLKDTVRTGENTDE